MTKTVNGFSKKTKEEKIAWLASTYLKNNPNAISILKHYWNTTKASEITMILLKCNFQLLFTVCHSA